MLFLTINSFTLFISLFSIFLFIFNLSISFSINFNVDSFIPVINCFKSGPINVYNNPIISIAIDLIWGLVWFAIFTENSIKFFISISFNEFSFLMLSFINNAYSFNTFTLLVLRSISNNNS